MFVEVAHLGTLVTLPYFMVLTVLRENPKRPGSN